MNTKGVEDGMSYEQLCDRCKTIVEACLCPRELRIWPTSIKPGPRQATPFMPERIGDHINCPKHGLKFGFCEECVESPEELPHMQGNETKAVSDLLNSMKVIDRHQRYQDCRSDVLTKLMYELAALRENKPTLPVPERTAEMAADAWHRAFCYVIKHGWIEEIDGIPDYTPPAKVEHIEGKG